MQDVNLKSVYLCSRAALRHMVAQQSGSIINTASFVAVLGSATSQISYTASKGGVLAMTKELGVQFARQGIRVNALCPGPVNTPLLQELFAKDPERAQRRLVHIPKGRFAEPEELAAAVAFLASDDASLHHGVHLPGRRRHQLGLRHAAVREHRRGREDVVPESLVEGALFRPVRSGNAFEDTVARLLQTIRLGIVAPGEALPPERDLAARFSVSRDTVREAIRELADAGYLVSQRGRYGGTFVSDPVPIPPLRPPRPSAPPRLEDVLGLREILELGAARAAAGRDAQRRRTRPALDAGCGTPSAGPPTTTAGSTRGCTSRSANSSGRRRLSPLLADNRTRVNELLDAHPAADRQHRALEPAARGDRDRRS